MNDASLDFGPAVVPFNRVVVGDDVAVSFQIVNADGTPYNLSSATFTAEISRLDGSIVGSFSIGNGISVSGNVVEWLIPSSLTAQLNYCSSYRYELVMINSGKKRTLLDGPFRVFKD
ncbi:MAG: hypothetical protein ABIK73_07445 [candidate division WOR-3 bacterium]